MLMIGRGVHAERNVLAHYINHDQNLIYENLKTREVSPSYAGGSYCYPPAPYDNYILTADNPSDVRYIILQPIFTSQRKVWILIQRDFDIPFPGLFPGVDSKFTSENNLYLVETVKIINNPRNPVANKTETIPIDYSIFEKSVPTPTCYTIPDNHKLRLCTAAEAQLRTPALKVFLEEK